MIQSILPHLATFLFLSAIIRHATLLLENKIYAGNVVTPPISLVC